MQLPEGIGQQAASMCEEIVTFGLPLRPIAQIVDPQNAKRSGHADEDAHPSAPGIARCPMGDLAPGKHYLLISKLANTMPTCKLTRSSRHWPPASAAKFWPTFPRRPSPPPSWPSASA